MTSVNTFAIVSFIVAVAIASNCGGNCPGNNCDNCVCGTSHSPQNVAAWCAKYSGWSQSCCQCIVNHESGGNANAICHNTNGSNDVGLWQVNSQNWGQCNGGHAPCDTQANLNCAIKVFNWGGNTWKLWSTCGACGCCGRNEEEIPQHEKIITAADDQ